MIRLDKTSSNTGRKSGACVLLEQVLGSPYHLVSHQQILELVFIATFSVRMGPGNTNLQQVSNTIAII